MKLKTPDWKAAWFENHTSERFFQEMAKIEKGIGLTLESSSQWMSQVMSETGQLAQSMMNLESEDSPAPQIRQAAERALRLAAMATHLLTTLDHYTRHETEDKYRMPRPLAASAPSQPPAAPQPAPPQYSAAMQPPPPVSPLARQGATSWLNMRPGTQGGSEKNAGLNTGGTSSEDPVPAPVAPAAFPAAFGENPFAEATPEAPLLSPFLKSNREGRLVGEVSEIRRTILSLSKNGLSVAEIEAVTGQPRHIITAALNHG